MNEYGKIIHLRSCPVYGEIPRDDEPCKCRSVEKLEEENKDLKEEKDNLFGAIKELTEFKNGLMKSYKKLVADYKILKEK